LSPPLRQLLAEKLRLGLECGLPAGSAQPPPFICSGAIAQTIVSLSQAMGLSVIAEGVETEEQREFLAGLGCHSFQGYLFSRPLPLEEFDLFVPGFALDRNHPVMA